MSGSNIEHLRDRSELVYDRFRPQHVNDLPAGFLDEVKKTLKRHNLESLIDPELYAMHSIWAKRWSKSRDPFTKRSAAEEVLERFDLCLTSQSDLWSVENGALEWSKFSFDELKSPGTNGFREFDLIKSLFDDPKLRKMICQGSDYISLIDLGCGNGEKAKAIIERLIDTVVCYYPVDKSMFMNAVALANVASLSKRSNCVLHDNNYYFYKYARSFAKTKRAKTRDLLKRAEIVRERYETTISRFEEFINYPGYDEYKKHGFYHRWMFNPKEGELTREQFISQQLNRLNEIHKYVTEAIQTRDRKKLRQLSVLSEILDDFFSTSDGSYSAGKFSAFYHSNPAWYFTIDGSSCHGETDRFGDDDLALKLQLMTGTYPFKLYDEDLFNMFRCDRSLNEMYNLLFGNIKGKIQFTAPSIGICADFDNIDDVIETLDCTNFIDNHPRLATLLGQTLGNFDEAQRLELCSKIYESLSVGDMLLIGVELRPNVDDPLYETEIEKIKDYYRSSEHFARQFLPEEVRNVPKIKFEVNYDPSTNDIVMRFRDTRPPKWYSRITRFVSRKSDENEFRSHKFTVKELDELLINNVGFQTIGRRIFSGGPSYVDRDDGTQELFNGRKEYALYLVRK